MSDQFRELLKKVGSGQHTKKDLTRSEAAIAGRMMLTQTATPPKLERFSFPIGLNDQRASN